jgi:transcriptional repressor NrdR
MRCIKCASVEDRVIDSRVNKDGTSIRRRRECLACGQRFTTTEEILREGLLVVKRDGRREDFDCSKMLAGIRRACEKRPVDLEQINMMVSDVTSALQEKFDDEIPSQAIGELLMDKLHQIDKVAYVRFASVYKDFRDVNEFMEEINRLEHFK